MEEKEELQGHQFKSALEVIELEATQCMERVNKILGK